MDISINSDGIREIQVVPFTIYEKYAIILDTFGMWLLRVAQILLICFKLESQTSSSWALIFIPTWLWGFLKIASICLMSTDSESKNSKRMIIQSSIVGFILSGLFIYLTFGMLASKLDYGHPKTSVILIPVFIVTGTLFCCVGCCLPLMVKSVRKALAQELKSDHQQVSVERRIESGSS
jgi:hypothetical protein